jgi:hypothetical protein
LSTFTVAASAQITNHCEQKKLPYDLGTQMSLLRGYLIKSGLDADKIQLGWSSSYPQALGGLIDDFNFVTWPIHELLGFTGAIRARDALFDTFGSIVLYGPYRIVCTTTINRFRDTPEKFELNIHHCLTLANHDVSYFEAHGLDPSRAKACLNQVELSGVKNATWANESEGATVSNGRVFLNRNGAELDACSLTPEEFANRPIIETSQMDIDYRNLVCN